MQANPQAQMSLLRQAAEWRILAALFERPNAQRQLEVESMVGEIDDEVLRQAVERLGAVTDAQYIDALGPGGLVSPREVAYRGREDPGRILADVSSFHEAFAFDAQSEDPPDHVARQCDFVSYLFLKEAYARARQEIEAADICSEAREHFLEEHLRTFAAPLAERLDESEHPVLAPAGRALRARVGEPHEPPSFEPVPWDEDGDLTCGNCPM